MTCFLDPRRGRRAHVQAHLARVDVREEIAADEGEQRKRHAAEDREERSDERTMIERPRERVLVALAPALEAPLEAVVKAAQQASMLIARCVLALMARAARKRAAQKPPIR
jgi:hypothetical protein